MVISQGYLKELLHYSKDTGVFTWLKRSSIRVNIGGTAGYTSKYNGYITITIGGKRYKAHRLAWLYMYGELPELHIDHIDHHRDNNAISNLRLVTTTENAQNQKLRSDNTSGIVGVRYHPVHGKYLARIQLHGKQIHLGSFIHIEDAVAARKAAEILFEFHENHGVII